MVYKGYHYIGCLFETDRQTDRQTDCYYNPVCGAAHNGVYINVLSLTLCHVHLRESISKGVYVDGLIEVVVNSATEAYQVMSLLSSCRHGDTDMIPHELLCNMSLYT